MPITNREVAWTLDQIGDILEVTGDNIFKSRAYHQAARTILGLGEDITRVVEKNELTELAGFGESLTHKVTELVKTGRMEYYEELKKKIPPGLLTMLDIPTVGPKRAAAFYNKLHVSTIEELGKAARDGRIAKLPGMGEKTQAQVLKGIEMLLHRERWLLSDALPLGEEVLARVRAFKSVRQSSLAGSIRRSLETIGDIDILVSSDDADGAIESFLMLPNVERVLAAGGTKASAVFLPGIQIDLRVVEDRSYAAALHYFTGNKDHNVRMRSIARASGRKLSEYGLFEGERALPVGDEAQLFAHFGMDWIPPELRENTGEIDAALERRLPDLVVEDDLRGAVHVHTSHSDGQMTIEEAVRAAGLNGYSYIVISDHSQSLRVAGGLLPEEVRAEWEEMEEVQGRAGGITMLRSTEVDIKKDGTLDFDDETLSGFDCRIAAIHSSFTMPAPEMTRRIIAAVKNPYTDILAHPTGRALLRREPYAFDVDAVLEACVENDVAIEINGQPARLDLDWRYVKRGKELGCKFVVSLDAHNVEDFAFARYGVAMARKGWLEKADVLNTLSAPRFKRWLTGRRRAAHAVGGAQSAL